MPEDGPYELALKNLKAMPGRVVEGWPFAVGFSLINVIFAYGAAMLPSLENEKMEMAMKALVLGAQDTAKFAYWDGTIITP